MMALNQRQILDIFKETGALLEGHFILTSGLHSSCYFQCAKVLQYPWHTEALCREIMDHFREEEIHLVVSPAIGGILVGQEIARLLRIRSVFTERVEGRMTLRRGFIVKPGERRLSQRTSPQRADRSTRFWMWCARRVERRLP